MELPEEVPEGVPVGFNLEKLHLSENPLDCTAHCEVIPTIRESNPEIILYCDPTPEYCGCAAFHRGDINADGEVDIADACCALSYLFGGCNEDPCEDLSCVSLPCLDAADANDDGALDISDAITVLSHLFAEAGALPPPFGSCGIDLTPDELDCLSFPPCEQ